MRGRLSFSLSHFYFFFSFIYLFFIFVFGERVSLLVSFQELCIGGIKSSFGLIYNELRVGTLPFPHLFIFIPFLIFRFFLVLSLYIYIYILSCLFICKFVLNFLPIPCTLFLFLLSFWSFVYLCLYFCSLFFYLIKLFRNVSNKKSRKLFFFNKIV